MRIQTGRRCERKATRAGKLTVVTLKVKGRKTGQARQKKRGTPQQRNILKAPPGESGPERWGQHAIKNCRQY